jgi:hypothetical protein
MEVVPPIVEVAATVEVVVVATVMEITVREI